MAPVSGLAAMDENAEKEQMMSVRRITPALFIRQHILGMTSVEFAKALGVSVVSVSRYDASGEIPDYHLDTVHKLAKKRGIVIKPSWFQAVPFLPGVPT